jgi:hypothetical protein
MLRKNLLLLLLGAVTVTGVHAQIKTNEEVLKRAAQGIRITDRANYARALALAKKNNWALKITDNNGAVAELVGVDMFNFPKYYITHNNSVSAITTSTNQLWPNGASGLNLSGSSANMRNKIGIWDGGRLLSTHVELNGRLTQKDNPSSLSTHATHVAGTMIATGVNPNAKGMSYGVQGMVAYDFTNDNEEIASEATNLLISNHSYSVIAGWSFNSAQTRWEYWGRPNEDEDYKFGFYSSDAQILDSIAYNAPFYLIVKSAGNNRGSTGPAVGEPYFRQNAAGTFISAGTRPSSISSNDAYGTIPWDGNAKNILTVGAITGLPFGYTRSSDPVVASFSSWGPTDDGRIKPDIVAAGVNVLSTSSSSNTSYTTLSGTSMSAPNATGSLFLLQEYYSKLKSGAFMRSATLKGLAIHTAEEAGNNPGPDYQMGWGLLNVRKGADVITAAVSSNNAASSEHRLYENVLNATTTSFSTTVIASGKMPIRATICWTDVKATVEQTNVLNNTARKLINDLDIRITSGSRTFRPWILDPASPFSAATKGDNVLDNVERIDIDSTVPGQSYTITVTHKGTLNTGQQAYSLLISGVGGTAYCTSAPDVNTGGKIDSVVVQSLRFANPAGGTTFVDNTGSTARVEPSQSVPFRIRLNSSDATDVDKIVKLFVDYNNDGDFADANELVATSSALRNNQVFVGTFTTPSTLVAGTLYRMRIVVRETSSATDVTACGSYPKGETHDIRLIADFPTTDLSVADVVTPSAAECADNKQYVTVALRNNGSTSISDVPVTVEIKNGNTTVASFTNTFKRTIGPAATANFTLQTPFTSQPNTTYTVSTTLNLSGDQLPANNTLTSSITTAPLGTAPTAVGVICNTNTATLKVVNPGTDTYFWYNSATATAPLISGPTLSTPSIPSNNTFYVSRNIKTSIGPATKMAFPNGGYDDFSGTFTRFTNNVPIVIESARLYTGNAGTVRITVADLGEVTGNSYNFTRISEVTLQVAASNPNPSAGTISGNPAADTGTVYMLNLPVNTTGDHIIIFQCSNGATIFRNNNITSTTTYPMSVPGLMSITGNSANLSNTAANVNAFYYCMYDIKVRSGESCPSDRVPVVISESPTPTVTRVGDTLYSSVTGAVMQWYKDDVGIDSATKNTFKPIQSGSYKILVMDSLGCQKTSAPLQVTINALAPEIVAQEIKLSVAPNPNRGIFNLSFEVKEKGDLQIDLLTEAGQRVYTQSRTGFIGTYNQQVNVGLVSDGYYVLRITHNKKSYLQKVIIIK